MNSILSYRTLWIAALVALMSPTAGAIDPLPPEVESASEQVKMSYINRMARESERQKRAVGHQRYERRLVYKQTLATHLRKASDRRRAAINLQMGAPALAAADSNADARQINPFFAFLLIVTCVFAFWYRFVFRNKGNQT
jgi:hypothetical protein